MSLQTSSSPYAAAASDQPSDEDLLTKVGDKPLANGQPRPMRQASIDIYRGLVMFLMMAEVLELMHLADAYPDSSWAQWLRFNTTHVQWVGLSLHDMIQPSFSFLVGVSLPFSILARKARGQKFASTVWHAAWRSVILVALGILLRSLGKSQTNFTFDDTLTQIGLGYFALFLLAHASRAVQMGATLLILVGYWALFAAWPLPPSDFDWQTVGIANHWPHLLGGFEAHWNKNLNPAGAFDQWFMNLFPREKTYTYSSGGYCTLSFIPTLATMLLGVLAGSVLRDGKSPGRKLLVLWTSGLLLLLVGWGLGELGVCPIVKRIWTPTWVLVSGGLCYLTLGALFAIADWRGWRNWAWPLMVIGANSIVAYVMSWTMEGPTKAFLRRHLGDGPFDVAGEAWQPVLLGAAVLLAMWLILLWLFRQRIFVRI
ncbi:MAG: DUF5009 domain-containing protein [Planctomycetales bacterium]|nr:DUF5009 domain-containing protein [Planctomycetales bacterium]MCA9181692.1 DUF5009 domain-containing protein [Planctomycetales bacterium]